MRARLGQDGGIVGGAVGARLVGAEVEADDPARTGPGEAPGDRRGAVVVEAEPVDDGRVLGEAEEARPRVAGLGQRGRGPDLDEAEAGREEGGHRDGVLVEAGGEPDGVRQGEAGEHRGEAGARDRPRARTEAEAEAREGHAMGGFRIGPAEQGQEAVCEAHGRISGP
jgi:hypothetical protein